MHDIAIGVDAGGTKTEVLARKVSAGTDVVRRFGAAANPQRNGLVEAAATVSALIRDVVSTWPDFTSASVLIGMAGARDRSTQEKLIQELAKTLPQERFYLDIVPDTRVALEAAIGEGSGVTAIVGTGSAVIGRTTSGEIVQGGGWGYLLGDEGGGYALGREALRLCTRHFDGEVVGELPHHLADNFGIHTRSDLIRRVYQEQWPLQEIAPVVLAAAAEGDTWSQHLVQTQAEALIYQVDRLVRMAPAPLAKRLVPQGGLAYEPQYDTALRQALVELLPEWVLEAPRYERPVQGALALALQKVTA